MLVQNHARDATLSVGTHTAEDDPAYAENPAKVGGSRTQDRRGDENNNNNAAAGAVLPKCVCSWKNCRAYQKAFREVKHDVFDGVVRIKLLQDHTESILYKESLDRTLGVTTPPVWKTEQHGESSVVVTYCKYTVARHHFTEQHMKKYDTNPKQFSFVKPFSLHGAKKYLYAINAKETLNAADDPSEALYLQCPNVPSDIVKVEYYRAMEIVKATKNKTSKSNTNDDDDVDDDMVVVNATSTVRGGGGSGTVRNTNKAGAITKATSSNKNQSNKTKYGSHHDDDAKSVGTFHVEVLKSKEAENKVLKDQLDAMKDQLTFLHDMVAKLQAQHFDGGASVVSNKSRKSRKTKGGAGKGVNKNTTGSGGTRQIGGQQQIQGPTTGVRNNSVPNEINYVDDDTESQTLVSQWNENDYGSDDDTRTQATTGTFQSRFSKSNPLPTHHDEDDVTDEEEEEDEDEEDETDGFDYNDCMSVGASTILSASRSVKALPRELELDENEDDSDDDDENSGNGDVEEETFESVSSSYHQSPCSSHQSFNTFGPNPGNKKKTSSQVTTIKNGVGNSQSSSDGPPPPTVGRLTRRGSIASSSSSAAGSNDRSINNPQQPQQQPRMHRRRSTASSSAASSSDTSLKPSNLYQVTDLEVTDPYGEKGTYSGSISKSTRLPHGHGRLEYEKAGRWYEGDWKHGRWTGVGALANGDGDFYQGSLKNDHKHGHGVMRFADGRKFEGRYYKGQMLQGKMTYQDGSTYDGQWVESMRHGYGRCVFADESIYEGEFVEGEFCGRGKMTWNDGGWYDGEWFDGEMHGYGREVRANGTLRHDGVWDKGQPVRQ